MLRRYMADSREGNAAAYDVSRGIISARTGIVTSMNPFESKLLPRAMVARIATCARVDGLGDIEYEPFELAGFGAGTSTLEAESAAIGEAVERYGSVVGSGRVDVEWGTYREFEDDAVHGDAFALPSSREINDPLVPFDENAPRGWVRGHDLTVGVTTLVPAQLVLPSYRPRFDSERIASWTSNGLAAHRDERAAVLAGLREIEERDAFVIRYLNRWTPPEMPIRGISADVNFLLSTLPDELPLKVRAWDITLDLGQPVVLVGVFSSDDALPPVCFGAACGGDYDYALRKGFFEAFYIMASMSKRGFRRTVPEPLGTIASPRQQFQQSLRPGYRETLSWLLDEYVEWSPAVCQGGGALSEVLHSVAERGLRVITVDLTPPELRDLDWHVCHVFVPGAQPLSFGQVRRATSRRLYELPIEFGLRDEVARELDLNPVPHPFA